LVDQIDTGILEKLKEDSRTSYAELGRLFNLTRASIKERVEKLRNEGVIEQFTIIVNPYVVGKRVSVFMEIDVEPRYLDNVAKTLSKDERVESLYLMTGASTLHMHALLENMGALEAFVLETVYAQEGILSVRTNTLLKRYKSKRGGPRL